MCNPRAHQLNNRSAVRLFPTKVDHSPLLEIIVQKQAIVDQLVAVVPKPNKLAFESEFLRDAFSEIVDRALMIDCEIARPGLNTCFPGTNRVVN